MNGSSISPEGKRENNRKKSGLPVLAAGVVIVILMLLFKFVIFSQQGVIGSVEQGIDLLKQEKFTESEKRFAAVIKADPALSFLDKIKNPELAYLGLANAALEGGDYSAAVSFYIKAFELDSSQFDKYAKISRSDYPYPEGAYIELGNRFWQAGRLQLSGKSYGRSLEINPGSISALTNLGNVRKVQGDIDEAGRLYNLALTIDPRAFEARVNLISLSLEEKRRSAVSMHVAKLQEYYPESPVVGYFQAELKKEEGKCNEALPLFDEYLKIRPDDFNTRLSMADCCLKTGEYDRAQNILRELALRYGSSEKLKIRALGPAEEAFKNREFVKAQMYYESMGAIWPNDPAFRFGQANCMIQLGDLAQAQTILEDMVHYYPNSSQILSNLGLVYAKMGKNEWAKEQFESAIAIDSPSIAFYNLGKVFESEGDSGKANACMIMAAMKDPEAFNLEDFLVELRMEKSERIARGDTAGLIFLDDRKKSKN